MPMGIVTDKDFEKEFNKFQEAEPTQKPVVKPIEYPQGRKEGDVNVPSSVRKLLGATAQEDGRKAALDLAHSLGISDSSVSAYAKGSNSTANYNSPNPEQKEHVLSAREKLAVKAGKKLKHALNAITPEKLANAKLRDISGVATAMATVIRTMGNDDDNDDDKDQSSKRPMVVLFAPKSRTEEDYVTITVNE